MSNHCSKMIQHLRRAEEVVLYAYLPELNAADLRETGVFLAKEYADESMEYPYVAPVYDTAAAIWAAKIVFNAAQLLLYREQTPEDITPLFEGYTGEQTAGAILSADLMLRFLPDILEKVKTIDEEDVLNTLLEKILKSWHYSGVRYHLDAGDLKLDTITANACLFQLYINRIIAYQNLNLAQTPVLREGVKAALGDYGTAFWKTFYNEIYEPNR